MNIEKIIDIVCQGKSDEQVERFLKFLFGKLWNQYKESEGFGICDTECQRR